MHVWEGSKGLIRSVARLPEDGLCMYVRILMTSVGIVGGGGMDAENNSLV